MNPVSSAHDRLSKALEELSSAVEYVSLPLSVLSKRDRRLDAETYLTGGYGLRLQLSSALKVNELGALADIWQPSRLKGIQVPRQSGIPFLTATQIFDIRPTARKWLALSKTPDSDQRFVEPGWILVTCSGSVGDAAIARQCHARSIISHDLLRVQVRNPLDRGYVYSYLRSRFGRTILRSSKYGAIVKHLEPEHLLDVPVPGISIDLRDELERHISQAALNREASDSLVAEAEQIYEQHLPTVPDGDYATRFTVRASEMFSNGRRIDGYYYNMRARNVLDAIARTATVELSDVTERIFGVHRFKHVYQNKGIPYLDSEDLFKVNPEITKFIPGATKADASEYFVDSGWLLMACSGQLYGYNGSVVLADSSHELKIISNHVLRIVPRDIRSGYLAMMLGHPKYGRPLVQRLAFGSEVPEISPESLYDVPVPRLGEVEDKIADRVEEASRLRVLASQDEYIAVSSLEADIEQRLYEQRA